MSSPRSLPQCSEHNLERSLRTYRKQPPRPSRIDLQKAVGFQPDVFAVPIAFVDGRELNRHCPDRIKLVRLLRLCFLALRTGSLTFVRRPTAMETLARSLIAIAPKLERFRTGHNGAIDIEINFRHSQNWITCTGQNEWNDGILSVI